MVKINSRAVLGNMPWYHEPPRGESIDYLKKQVNRRNCRVNSHLELVYQSQSPSNLSIVVDKSATRFTTDKNAIR
jgi:hypothetical protein